MVGVVLKFTGDLRNSIKTLFNSFDFNEKCIDIKYWESYGDSSDLDFNEFATLSNCQILEELIIKENEIYPEFAEIFIRNKSALKTNIETYNDFIVSEYELSLVIIDRRNIEICSKKTEYLDIIIENFSKCNLENKKIKLLDTINLDAKIKCWRHKNDLSIY